MFFHSAVLSKVGADAKITRQESKAITYSPGDVEFHSLSPDDSAHGLVCCLDSGHRSVERLLMLNLAV